MGFLQNRTGSSHRRQMDRLDYEFVYLAFWAFLKGTTVTLCVVMESGAREKWAMIAEGA